MSKTPKYVDGRYPHGYTPAASTDIRKTFRRVREQMKLAQQERQTKVCPMRKAK